MKNSMTSMTILGMVLCGASALAMQGKSSYITSIEAPANSEVLIVTTLDPLTTGRIRGEKISEREILTSMLVETTGVKATLPREIPVTVPGSSLRLMVVAQDTVSFPNLTDLSPKNTLVVASNGTVTLKADH